jgi:hypothetical protein
MAFADAEIVTLAEIVGENYQATQWWAQNLTTGQEASARADLTTWATLRDKHTRIRGGEDGVDVDPSRKRAAIRRRLRLMLRLGDSTNQYGFAVVRG